MWTALIGGYADAGDGENALYLAKQMECSGVTPDLFTILCCLKACRSSNSLAQAYGIHLQAILRGLEGVPVVGNTLVDMYAKYGMLETAHKVFDSLLDKNVVSWTALISGYTEHGHGESALGCFKQMHHYHSCSNTVTFICVLKACSTIGAVADGQYVHSEIVKRGLEREPLVGNTLINMYAKWGFLAEAHAVLDKVPDVNVVACNALLSGYVDHGNAEEVFTFFEEMQKLQIAPNSITFVCCLKACRSTGVTGKSFRLHKEIIKAGCEKVLLVSSTLADTYAKSGFLAEAQTVFNTLPVRDVIAWTALITGYAEHDRGDDALYYLEEMQREGVYMNVATLTSALKACANVGAVVKGKEIHTDVFRKGLENDSLVSSSLVCMYAKSGFLKEANNVFDMLPVQDEVAFNSLLIAYAQIGESDAIFSLFDKMCTEDRRPDMVTFIGVLHACSHSALVDEGQISLNILSSDYGIIPTVEHCSCMIDLFSRAGNLCRIFTMILKMPFHPGTVEWITVLGACQRWSDERIGKLAFEHAVELDNRNIGAYTSMYNICADVYMKEVIGHEYRN
ncbi:hypothetical protein KP509_10G001600 [Ceratopteris richardii]|nr:hypothetical protein KP509_10G001600 [Ceratopteris richardii]